MPYGTEALGVMRIEKGHIGGGELNGQTTARDLGLGRMMSAKKDYIGRVMAKRSADLIAAAEAAFGIAPPTTPRRVESAALAFVWSGPDRWLAHRASEPPGGMEALLAPLAAQAAVVDQSHARTLLRISGPRVRDALAKGVALDLDPRAFRPGDAAMTGVAHIAVQLWQTDKGPTYVLSVARSLAGSFWSWLEASAAEYGLELAPPPPMAETPV